MVNVLAAASAFREALEKSHTSIGGGFKEFPRGACGPTSELLGVYLKEQGLGIFEYYCAELSDGTHAWLQSGEVVVDITADQFPQIHDPVIVSKNSQWHQSLDAENRGECDFRDEVDSINYAADKAAYQTIINTIEQGT